MTYLKSLNAQSLGVLVVVLLAAMFVFMPETVFAAGLDGVEKSVTSTLTKVKNIMLAVIPIAAGIVLVWKCWKGVQEHQPVSDIITTAIWIVCAACAVEFAVWIFGEFGAKSKSI